MSASSEKQLPQEGTRREAGESLPGTSSLDPGCPTVSGGGKKTPCFKERRRTKGEDEVQEQEMETDRGPGGESDSERESEEVSGPEPDEWKSWEPVTLQSLRDAKYAVHKMREEDLVYGRYLSSVMWMPIDLVMERIRKIEGDDLDIQNVKAKTEEQMKRRLYPEDDETNDRIIDVGERLIKSVQHLISKLPDEHAVNKKAMSTSMDYLSNILVCFDNRNSESWRNMKVRFNNLRFEVRTLKTANETLNTRVLKLKESVHSNISVCMQQRSTVV